MSLIIKVKVQTRASTEKIEEVDVDEYKVWVTVPAAENQANEALIEKDKSHRRAA